MLRTRPTCCAWPTQLDAKCCPFRSPSAASASNSLTRAGSRSASWPTHANSTSCPCRLHSPTISVVNCTASTAHSGRSASRPGAATRHVVLQSTRYRRTLDWYLEHFGLIVSDFLYFDGQRHRGPTMSFIRCDRGSEPADHHTLAITLGPANRYVHSAYQVVDLDAIAAGGEYLRDEGYRRSWGIGRHNQGSQIFDYWRDPDGFLVEHFSDGDMFDSSSLPVGHR